MSFDAKILADSYSPDNNSRLITVEATFPRFILAELNTHRVFSRNSSSSRAIPTWKILDEVRDNPFIPDVFGSYQPGMVSGNPLNKDSSLYAKKHWLKARDQAMYHAMHLVYGQQASKLWVGFYEDFQSLPKKVENGTHKELVNRLLEPFMWQTAIISSTEWDNFFNLRCADNAQPQIRKLAGMIRDAIGESTPQELNQNQWHTPLITPEEDNVLDTENKLLVSAGRCARISYLNHHNDRKLSDDIKLAKRLLNDGHMSPFEHQARPLNDNDTALGNFHGWIQQRHVLNS